MGVNMKNILMKIDSDFCSGMHDVTLNPEQIQAVLINEAVPQNSREDFYGDDTSNYAQYAYRVLRKAGIMVQNMEDLLTQGIYLTNAVKIPKTEHRVDSSWISPFAQLLKKELSMFPNVKVIVLMGDVAIKVYKKSLKLNHKTSSLPAGSTYKLRKLEFYDEGIRILPSYIMTGRNVDIEKSKFEMLAQDLCIMKELIMQ